MPCSCKELERRYGSGGCKCVHFREKFPDCACEKESVSDLSPGPVDDDEILIRTFYSPTQINQETGEPDPVHIRNDALKRGASVNRKRHITEAELRSKIERKIEGDRANGKRRDDFFRVATARSDDVRALADGKGNRLFCVYDTATEDDKSHADICQAIDIKKGTPDRKGLQKRIGSRLVDVFLGKAVDLATIYGTDG